MERLTYRGERDWEVKGADGTPCDVVCENRFLFGCHDCPIQTAFDRLAAYEDTGLEPEEINAVIDGAVKEFSEYDEVMPKHLVKELAQAEKDGRLVVLPCKVGDKVYRVITTLNAAPVITGIDIKTLGQAADLIGRIGEKRLLVSWYLTREEAEAALKKREEADNEAD